MALGATQYLGAVGPPADLAVYSYERVRFVLDGTIVTNTLTPPATLGSGIKTVYAVIGASSNVPNTGVAVNGTNTIVINFGAGVNLQVLDVLLWGAGK